MNRRLNVFFVLASGGMLALAHFFQATGNTFFGGCLTLLGVVYFALAFIIKTNDQ